MAEEKKDDKNTVEERVGKVLSEALAEDLGEIPEVSISVEELRKLEMANRKKRHKKFTKFVSVAAVAVIVCAAVLYLAWPEAIVPVDADKNTEQHVEEGDNGEIIINEGNVEGDSGIVKVTETDWKKVKNHRSLVPKLGTPQYIPQGFNFKKLFIEKYKNDGFSAQYLFVKDEIELRVEQRQYENDGVKSSFSGKNVEEIVTELGKVYLMKEGKIRIAVRYIDDGELKVIAPISKDEQISIINKIALNQ